MNPVNLLDDRIKNLPYVHLYAGLSYMHPWQIGEKTFDVPISDSVNIVECLNSGRYEIAFPNDKFNSCWLILKDGNLTMDKFARRNKIDIYEFEQDYKLIGWYNADKLGLASNRMMNELNDDLVKNVFSPEVYDGSGQVWKVKISTTNISDEVPREFKPFEKNLLKSWNMHPFGWITIEFTMNWQSTCKDDLAVGTPVECSDFNLQ